MLTSLEIRDLLIIDHLVLEPGEGLNALTGETGAGKSILLDSLGFVLGWRGRADLVRQGAEAGEVTAVFELAPTHRAWALLEEAGIAAATHEPGTAEPGNDEPGELILRRVVRAQGRKSAWINGVRASGEVLRAVSDTLVELHGQQDDRGLLNPQAHRVLLDAFGGHGPRLSAVRRAWRDWQDAERALGAAEAGLQAARAEEDFLRHAVAELEELAPEPGEEARLDSRRRLMQAAEKMRADISRASEALGPGEGAEGQMGAALRWLEEASRQAQGTLDAPLEALGRALIELGEAASGVEQALDALSFDVHELESCEERLFAIRALARKHAVAPDALADLARSLAERLAALDAGSAGIAARRQEAKDARLRYERAAGTLSTARAESAHALDAAMQGELAPLRMERATFHTVLGTGEPGPQGSDSVTFTAATNPGAPAGALNRIASGGELSRFLLALKVCLTADDSGRTLIFDEIDRGVGGATADAVGRRLADLGRKGQVIVVTHSPQVAARAHHHWNVSKNVAGGVTLSEIAVLDAAGRVDEIARMLAGDIVTDEARAAARALLEGGNDD